MKLFKPKPIQLLNNAQITEARIQQMIADDPSIIGLGDLVLKDQERRQPKAGRLDLLMQDSETNRRFEIELQLGRTDESHIIRCIEYWDIERKRYPQYDHCAVIIAEDITSRFLNVISLFNGHIPLIAIQVNAYKFGDDIGLVFTKVLDEMPLGLIEEDEEVKAVTNRDYWLKRGSETTLKMADAVLAMINEIAPGYELKYNKFYIGLAKNGQPNNFAVCRPKKNYMILEVKHPKTPSVDELIESSGIELISYDPRWGNYRLRLAKSDMKSKQETIIKLLNMAYQNYY